MNGTDPSFYVDDITPEAARAAHRGTSFSPEERGNQERAGYASQLARDYADLLKLAGTPEKLEALEVEFTRYRAGYKDRYVARLAALSRCMSTMVTGPAKFPTARNAKANSAAEKRTTELIEFRTRALAAIKRTLTPELAPIMAGDSDATGRLAAKIAKSEANQAAMKAANAAIRKYAKLGPEAQVRALVALGFSAEAALKPDFAGRVGFPAYQLTNLNANIKRMKERLATISVAQATPETAVEGADARLEDSPADNRVRLFYPGKPSAEVRARLKGAGFRDRDVWVDLRGATIRPRWFVCHCCGIGFGSIKQPDSERDVGYGTCAGCAPQVAASWVKHGFPGDRPITLEQALARLARYA